MKKILIIICFLFLCFVCNADVPTVSSISPTSGIAGTNVAFTIYGSNFENGAIVNLTRSGSDNLTTVGSLVDGNLTGTFSLPSTMTTGKWNVSVNQGGLYSNDDVQFEVTSAPVAPTVSSISPTSGIAGTSVAFTIYGSNFENGAIVNL
ncbi:MAG TPA: IPT/TIG domain-containing protein, partial [Methanospirillum sp.]|uniref:IPT/TIG domain-containing protein n=1 Tax=Methanospirillum sp. TaxID=45200 RepID=UPI002CBE3505